MLFLRFLQRMLREQKSRFVGVAVLMAIVAITEALIIMLAVPLLNMVVQGSVAGGSFIGQAAVWLEMGLQAVNLELSLGLILVIIVLMFVAQGLFRLLQMHMQMNMVTTYESNLTSGLFGGFLNSSWGFFLQHKIGQLINVFSVETTRAANAFQFGLLFIASLLITIFYVILAGLISWEITLAGVVLCSAASILLRSLMKKAREYGFSTTAANNDLQSYAYDKLSAAKMLKASVGATRARDGINAIIRRKIHLRYLSNMNATGVRSLYEPVVIAILAIIGYLSVSLWDTDIATILLFIFIFFRLVPHFTAMQHAYQQSLVFLPGLEEVDKLYAEIAAMPDTGGDKPFTGLRESIVFRDVSFGYEAGTDILKHIDLEIKKGETVAIVGESGSGKTTFVDLLMALFPPTGGEALADGVPLHDYDLASYRKSLGYMSQDIFLFHDSIETNLKWNKPDASEEELRAAVRTAHADDFLEKLPDKYDTVIGDRGVKLSVGQRQRLALARTILQDPEVIILDEATSSLDSESEAMIQRAIDAMWGKKTMVIIAHRLATVRNADRIYVLADGTFVENGSWDELVARGGRFEQLRKMQNL